MDNKTMFESIFENAIQVITQPGKFYRNMAKTGGLTQPIIFMVVMAVVTAVLLAVFSLFGVGSLGAMAMGLGGVILLPIMAVLASFIGAGIMLVIWKLLGSSESYEVAYRCVGYASAIYPLTALLGLIPYLGSIIGVAWGMYLMVIASTKVHLISQQTASVVFGIIGLVLIVTNLSGEMAARRMASNFDGMAGQLEKLEEMTPEEAGEAVGKFLKGLEKAREKP